MDRETKVTLQIIATLLAFYIVLYYLTSVAASPLTLDRLYDPYTILDNWKIIVREQGEYYPMHWSVYCDKSLIRGLQGNKIYYPTFDVLFDQSQVCYIEYSDIKEYILDREALHAISDIVAEGCDLVYIQSALLNDHWLLPPNEINNLYETLQGVFINGVSHELQTSQLRL